MKMVPLISSSVAGPLGVVHLPRLWLKLSLAHIGQLAEGYSACGDGFDRMVLQALNLSPDAVQEFIGSKKPTYPQFEDWIVAQNQGKIDAVAIDKVNYAVLSYNHSEEIRAGILASNGLDEGDGIHDAVSLNNLDDWQAFHEMFLDR